VDGGVVDQDVEPAVAAVEAGGDLLDAGWVGNVPVQHPVPHPLRPSALKTVTCHTGPRCRI
jgi:hypothetical protein